MIVRRIGAHLVDTVLFSVLAMVLFATVWSSQLIVHENVGTDYCRGQDTTRCFQVGPTAVELGQTAADGIYVAMAGYWVVVGIVEGITGAFVGKRLMRIRVIAREGGRAGVVRGLLRGLFMVVDLFFFIGVILMAVTRPSRRVGDFAARTLVVPADADTAGDAIVWDDGRNEYVHVDPATGARHHWDADRNEWVPEH